MHEKFSYNIVFNNTYTKQIKLKSLDLVNHTIKYKQHAYPCFLDATSLNKTASIKFFMKFVNLSVRQSANYFNSAAIYESFCVKLCSTSFCIQFQNIFKRLGSNLEHTGPLGGNWIPDFDQCQTCSGSLSVRTLRHGHPYPALWPTRLSISVHAYFIDATFFKYS